MDETEVMGRMEQNGTKGNNLLKIPATKPKFDNFYDRSSFTTHMKLPQNYLVNNIGLEQLDKNLLHGKPSSLTPLPAINVNNSVVCTTGYFNYKTQDEWLDDNCKIKPNIKFHADKLKIPAIDNSVTEYIVCNSGCFDYETQVKWLDDIDKVKTHIKPQMDRHAMPSGRHIIVPSEGRPVTLNPFFLLQPGIKVCSEETTIGVHNLGKMFRSAKLMIPIYSQRSSFSLNPFDRGRDFCTKYRVLYLKETSVPILLGKASAA